MNIYFWDTLYIRNKYYNNQKKEGPKNTELVKIHNSLWRVKVAFILPRILPIFNVAQKLHVACNIRQELFFSKCILWFSSLNTLPTVVFYLRVRIRNLFSGGRKIWSLIFKILKKTGILVRPLNFWDNLAAWIRQ